MMRLYTHSQQLSTNQARVFWKTGERRFGILDITIDFHHEEAGLIAELVAIKHLLTIKQVFDRIPSCGTGYKLLVSRGAIKKIALGKSDKKFAQKFASLLTGKLQGADYEVSTHMSWLPDPEVCIPETLYADSAIYAQTHEYIETPSMGALNITKHALEQYIERLTDGDPKKPWASLEKRLMNPMLVKKELSEKVLKHKNLKYGRSDNIEAWGHPDSTFVFLVIRDNPEIGTLVTVFNRNEGYE